MSFAIHFLFLKVTVVVNVIVSDPLAIQWFFCLVSRPIRSRAVFWYRAFIRLWNIAHLWIYNDLQQTGTDWQCNWPPETLITFTHRSPPIYNVGRYLEKPNIHAEWGVVSSAQLIYRPGSYPDVHQQACIETGWGCFTSTPYPIHPPLHSQPASH